MYMSHSVGWNISGRFFVRWCSTGLSFSAYCLPDSKPVPLMALAGSSFAIMVFTNLIWCVKVVVVLQCDAKPMRRNLSKLYAIQFQTFGHFVIFDSDPGFQTKRKWPKNLIFLTSVYNFLLVSCCPRALSTLVVRLSNGLISKSQFFLSAFSSSSYDINPRFGSRIGLSGVTNNH